MSKAVIFDLDGVLIDSLDAHFKAWTEFWRRRGKRHTRVMFDAIVATSAEETLRIRNKTFGTHIPINEGVKEREALFGRYARGHLRLYPGAMALLKTLKRTHRLGLATSSGHRTLNYVWKLFPMLKKQFRVVVTKNEVKRSKPDPAIYLLACKRLGCKPSECVVVEDAPNGIKAAKRAGMKVVAVMQTFGRKKLKGADVIVSTIRSKKLLESV
ncbi:HAD family phosphatase [Candidatus Woesearchaeota archaeon]|nr:HAD family phosphatase [Candidatus Woesearchaeota archaeon]